MITPNTVLTDNLNGTFITYNGNEFSLQNDAGNRGITDITTRFYPIGMVEYGGIIYIVSVKDPGSALSTFEIGTFPSLTPPESFDVDNISEKHLKFEEEYRPLYNLIRDGQVTEFRTGKITGYDLQHPVTIDVQPSYDGSVNLILNDGKNNPRLINSGFAVLGNGEGKFVKRNQGTKTNYYDESKVDLTTRLINVSHTFTKVDLGTLSDSDEDGTLDNYNRDGVQHGGKLKGGNYTFYFKFGDDDGNQTDIICESGIVSVFNGTPSVPNTISGAFYNEETDKLVKLTLSNIDTSYSRVYVYYTREYCDLNGYRLVECKELTNPFKIKNSSEVLVISGNEETKDISIEELNIYYHTVSSAKTSAQQQNMLFLGNITTKEINSEELQNCSYEIEVKVGQNEDIGKVDQFTYDASAGAEYYDPHNIYYKLGYWPDEIYRFGIVYIKSDGSVTQVYNLKGCSFSELEESNRSTGHRNDYENSDDGIFINDSTLFDNLYGVFKTPEVNLLKNYELIKPLYFNFKIPQNTIKSLSKLDIIGYFIVRQKRIPITVCQGFSVGIDKNAYIPMLKGFENGNNQGKSGYVTESFITRYSDEIERITTLADLNLSEEEKSEWSALGLNNETIASRLLLYEPKEIGTDTYSYFKTDQYSLCIYYYYEKSKHGKYRVHLVAPKDNDLDHIWASSGWYWFSENARADLWSKNPNIISKITNNGELKYRDAYSTYTGSDGHSHTTMYGQANINANNVEFVISSSKPLSKRRFITTKQTSSIGLLSVEAMVNPEIQSMFNGTNFSIEKVDNYNLIEQWPSFSAIPAKQFGDPNDDDNVKCNAKLIYIPENTRLKYIDDYGFSTQIGDGINPEDFGFLETSEHQNDATYDKLVRGHYTPFIGAIMETGTGNGNVLYNIRIPHSEDFKSEFVVRANAQADFFAITDKVVLDTELEVYRGDCFVNTVTIRMNHNFIDQNAPIADKILDPEGWRKYYHGYNNLAIRNDDGTYDDSGSQKTRWDKINIADLNTVSLGHWVTFKCLANSNLGLRSVDTFHPDEMALMGNPRAFYPLYGMSTATGMKLEESHLLNDGYNATVGRRRNTLKQDTPYDKNEFSTRIIFSNVSETDAFTNGYRLFQGLSYRDYPKQYGSITKILPWGNNLFCVFEHGIAIIPVNEKALMQTTTEQTIHIYGTGVLSEQMSIVSQDFGSYWADSVIRTPLGIYGVDTSAKKIWRYTDKQGFETISDMKIQRFLNDNINLGLTTSEYLGITNVKSHYNNRKGDVMFVFYHTNNNKNDLSKYGTKEWNVCYNERQGLWVTRYSWIPLMSANIDNVFYSIEKIPYGRSYRIQLWEHEIINSIKNSKALILPCNWYDKQHPFEFEFVVNDPVGLHKIFEDLTIVSNNVQPHEIEFELIGDDYLFNRARIYHTKIENIGSEDEYSGQYNMYGDQVSPFEYMPYSMDFGFFKSDYWYEKDKNVFKNARVEYDPVLDEYTLVIVQPCKNKEAYGIRLGNIQYKEDCWYTNIEPLRYNEKLNDPDYGAYLEDITDPDSSPNEWNFSVKDKFASTKLRDKWIKIRIKYKGDRLAIVSGVTTVENMSYA